MNDSFDENPWKDAIIEDLEVVPPDRFYVVADNGQYFEIVPDGMSMKLDPIDPSIIDSSFCEVLSYPSYPDEEGLEEFLNKLTKNKDGTL